MTLHDVSEFYGLNIELNKKSKGDRFEVSGKSNAVGKFDVRDLFHYQSGAAIVFYKTNASNLRSDGSVLFKCSLSCQCSANVADTSKFGNEASKARPRRQATGLSMQR